MWQWLTKLAADMAAAELPDPLVPLHEELARLSARVTRLEAEVVELRAQLGRPIGKISGGGEL